MKKGFTLIELLAVIVILAIIALIASPIVIGLIEDANKETRERSMEAAIEAAKTRYAMHQMDSANTKYSFGGTAAAPTLDATLLEMDNAPKAGTITLTVSGTTVTYSAAAVKFNATTDAYTCTYNATAGAGAA